MDLASRFNGEIINGDAMQMYRGLPIITNQIPVEERNGIPHHLLSCIELEEEAWRIGIFKRETLRLIKDIHARGKLPVLVGGTHYYTQAVLFKDQTVGENADIGADESTEESASSSIKWPILDAPTEVVLQKLREVDPVMADRWHPNEMRKIRRSLEIYFQTGRPASEVYAEQKHAKQITTANDGSHFGTEQLRFPTMLFWVHTEREALSARLEKRVDVMVEQGLMAEARKMFDYIQEKQSQGIPVDQTRGVWISIGFKELAPYFEALGQGSSSQEELENLKRSSIESIKIATRQYSSSQIKWVRNKLHNAFSDAGMAHRLYVLDSSKVEDWEQNVTQPSERLVHALLNNEPTPDPKSLSELARTTLGAKEEKQRSGTPKCVSCDVCQRTMTSEQWDIHIHGAAHRRALKHQAKKAERDEFLQKRESTNNTQEQANKS